MKVGWGLGLASEVLPTETCPLSQGQALDIGPRLGAGYPARPGPPPPGLGLDPRSRGWCLGPDAFFSELRIAFVWGGEVYSNIRASLWAPSVKNLSAVQGTWV